MNPIARPDFFGLVVVTSVGMLPAQVTGRAMQLLAPAVPGQTAEFGMTHPTSAAGNPYAFLWGMPPFAGTTSLSVPGFSVQGLLRVAPAATGAAFFGVLGTTGAVAHSMPIPMHPPLLGVAWDMQSIDLDPRTATVSLADDELTLVVRLAPSAGLHMVWVQAGTFLMGSPETPQLAPYFNQVESQPVHAVAISNPFWIGQYEVTQSQYQAVMGANPSAYQAPFHLNAGQRPVERVTWTQAMAYCAALTAIEQAAGRLPAGYQYRLPTEAEWEYCCRAGSATEFHYGATLSCRQSNILYSEHSNAPCPGGETSPVGSYVPNGLGLHDMHGNVWEWCLDRWDGLANYPLGGVVDPYVQVGSGHVARGGSFDSFASACRSAFRRHVPVGYSAFSCGFRVVCAPILP